MGEDPNRRGASRRWIITAVEHSLRRLQTDYIDLYQYHRPDTETDLEERSSTASTRSSRPAATSAASTWPTTRPPSSSRP
jgi:aryl-alcohol dehydrogenase-like predicted oxidoreductase